MCTQSEESNVARYDQPLQRVLENIVVVFKINIIGDYYGVAEMKMSLIMHFFEGGVARVDDSWNMADLCSIILMIINGIQGPVVCS